MTSARCNTAIRSPGKGGLSPGPKNVSHAASASRTARAVNLGKRFIMGNGSRGWQGEKDIRGPAAHPGGRGGVVGEGEEKRARLGRIAGIEVRERRQLQGRESPRTVGR